MKRRLTSDLEAGDFEFLKDGLPLGPAEVPNARQIVSGPGLTGGGDLSADLTLAVGENADGSIVVNADDVQVGVLATDAQHGDRGGGNQHALVVAFGDAGFMSGADKALLDGLATGGVPTNRSLTAGSGMTGGGDLTADRTFNVIGNADGSILANANDVQVGVLATDAQHGTRGGGTQHSDVVAAGASGFMTGADKTKLDGVPAVVPPATRNLIAGTGLTGGGDLSADRTFNVAGHADGSIVANANDVQVGTLATDGQHGSRGGGTTHAVAVSAGAAGFMSGADKAALDAVVIGSVPNTRDITAGAGLVGGGNLTIDRTLSVAANADGSIAVNADDIQVGVLATDVQHGVRGGGTQHAAVVAAGASGFMTGADKSKLDGVAPSAIDAAGVFTALAAASGSVSVNNQKITNLGGPPTSANDAVNKSYADALAQGLKAKDSVHVISVTPITLSGLQVVDGHSLGANHPVLVGGQGGSLAVPHIDNGIYLAQTGAWTRRSDFAVGAAVGGATTFTTQGTTYDDTGWVCTNALGSDIVGTDAIGFTQFSSSIALATAAPLNVTKSAAVLGTSSKAAREDHKHDITTAAPSTIGTANSEGTATSVARSDHGHDHGAQTSGTLHAAATTSVAGFLSAADKTLLDAAVPGARTITAGTGLTGGGDLSANRTLDVVGHADGSILANANDVQVGVLATDAQHGVRGGGSTHALVVSSGAAGFMSGADKAILDGLSVSVPSTRTLTAGAGLTGGGDLSANRTFDVVANADGSIVANANDVQVGVLATDAQHGNRGGGAIHANAVAAGAAGFMTGADKTKLDGITTGASSGSLIWGANSIAATADTRYMTSGYDSGTAGTAAIGFIVPRAGTIKNMRVRHNTVNGSGATVVYTLVVNGTPSTLTVTQATGAIGNGADTTHTVAVAAGDRIELTAVKALSITSGNLSVTVSVEFAG